MKLVIFLIIVGCLQVSARVLAQKVTLNEKDAPLEKVFNDIKKQTGYIFFYEKNALDGTAKVTISVKDANLMDVLNQCFANQQLVYTIVGNTIGVKKKENPTVQQIQNLPPKDITGQVVNKQGIPLVYATVLLKRTKSGTLTDVKGNFTLRGVLPDDIFVVSYLGYKPTEVKVGDKTVFNLVMEETTNALDAVVVQAYGQTSQRLNTGDIGTVTAAEIERQPVMNPLEAIMGKIPGLVVAQTSGYASAPINVQIRGRAGISSGSDPLFIIDGVPMSLNGTGTGGFGIIQSTFNGYSLPGPANGQSPLFSINPSDIESITVLKDADATAIYGSRGANGVIIISTKKGKAGKTKLDMNVNQGIQKITNHYDLMNTKQYLAMRREAFKNDGILPDQGNAYDLLVWDTTRNTDFQKLFWSGLGEETDIETGLSGGDKQTTFRISGGYRRQKSIFAYNGAEQRGSLQFNLTHKSLNQRLSISFSNLYSYTQSNLIDLGGNVTDAPDTPPIFDAAHNLNYAGWAPVSYRFPYASLLQPYIGKTGFLNSTLNIQYELFRGLTASTQFGYSTTNSNSSSTTPIISQDPSESPVGSSVFTNGRYNTIIIEPQLNYVRTIARGKLTALIGGSFHSVSYNGNYISGNGYVDDNLLNSISNAPIKFASDFFSQYKYSAVFGRLNYNWDDKYILNLSARRDGSSRFGPGYQFGNFGAVGAAWIFSEESWVKQNLSFLSFGKLRGSYGLTGSDQTNDYEYLTRWSGSVVLPYQGSTSYIPTQHANPLLHWQTNRKLEVGMNLGFLKDRLTLELSWYRNICGDQLIQSILPSITGFNSVAANFPATVQNSGWESTITAKIIDKDELHLDFNFDIGINRNKLLAFPNLDNSAYFGQYFVGQPLNITRLLHFTGVDPQTGTNTFLDKNKDGQIDNYYADAGNDLFIKDLSVKFDGGFGTALRYKSWQLDLFFNFRKQELPSAITYAAPGQINLNQSVQVLNRWTKPGDIAKFARFTTNPSPSDQLYLTSDAVYSDGSYIRLKNASVSYEFSEKWMKKAGFQKCQIFLRGENIFILTKYDGVDPDVPGLGGLPPAKVFITGIQFVL